MITISANDSKFKIFGSGYNATRSDSGEGEKVTWYDGDGNGYDFTLMKAKIKVAPSSGGTGNDYSYRSDNADKYWVNMNVKYDDYGATVYNGAKQNDKLFFDVCENNVWCNPQKLQGFTMKNLIALGALADEANASCKLYKEEPLSNNYIEMTINSKTTDFLKNATGVYADVDITAYSVSCRFVKNGLTQGQVISYAVNEFDYAVCEIEKYDGTKGLGVCVANMTRVPVSLEQTPTTIRYSQQGQTNEHIFGLLDLYFG